MNATKDAQAQGVATGKGWLMLITEVPSKPDYLRVKLRRKVQRLGAIGLKGAVYLLPQSPDSLESFQWLRREIVADGGDASVCVARLVDGMTDADVTGRFNADRDEEYQAFIAECGSLAGKWEGSAPADRPALIAERGRLFSRLEEILGRDFFSAPRREEAMQGLERLAVLDIASPEVKQHRTAVTEFSGRTWSTRAGVKVDRIASAWLIRRAIDPAGTFSFVAEGSPASEGSVRFDMFDGDFTHDGNRCTFEVLLDHFAITDPALRIVGQLVHDIDLHEDTFARPETAGFAAMIDGIVRGTATDADRLKEGARMLDIFVAGLRS